jgi:hypothetical protein
MSEERLIHQGQRAELRLLLHQAELRLDSLRKQIRVDCNVLTDPAHIPADEILMLATDLRATQIDYLDLRQKLDKIREILGDA